MTSRESVLNRLTALATILCIAGVANALPPGWSRYLIVCGGALIATCFWFLPVRPVKEVPRP